MSDVAMEDYLKGIYYLQDQQDTERVRTSDIAEVLDVTAPTVTSMLSKLAEEGYIDHEKYNGATLTPEGERIALRILRNHRLIEGYLTSELDYQLSEVHKEADRLEHHISDKLAERLEEALDDPRTDPHGAPIPTPSLTVSSVHDGEPLGQFDEGIEVEIQEVSDRDDDVLSYLSTHGIVPGARVTIEEVAPVGLVTVSVAETGESVSLPEDATRLVWASSITEVSTET